MSRDMHRTMHALNNLHFSAHPVIPTPGEIAEYERRRDALINILKSEGRRIVLVKADWMEDCGRYVCEDDDGFNGYDPLKGSVSIEQEV